MDVSNSIDVVLLYLLSIVSTNLNGIVDHIIGNPGYGKNIVDGINSYDKRYLVGNRYDWYLSGGR